MLRITQHRRLFYVFSGIVMAASLAAWLAWGLKPGIDFTGGSMLELEFSAPHVSTEDVVAAASGSIGSNEVTAQPLGENGIVLRMPSIDEAAHQELLKDLKDGFEKDGVVLTEKRFESIGPVIGEELRKKTIYAVFTAIIAIVLY
ncbi:MAG TPA: protein translocase subunit SecF, partial [Patescibacteria group bacterium]|nr:protein translocase subunit SecF [Patescibacteria group bacterium]